MLIREEIVADAEKYTIASSSFLPPPPPPPHTPTIIYFLQYFIVVFIKATAIILDLFFVKNHLGSFEINYPIKPQGMKEKVS